jgi:hypothetical protein
MTPIEPRSFTRKERRAFAAWLGKRSYRARLERLGIEKIRVIARENGKKGGRPKGGITP